MAKLGNLFISLFADTAQFSSGLAKAKSDLNSSSALMNQALAKVDKSFHALGDSLKDMGAEIFSVKGAFTALIGTIGVGSIVELGKQAVEAVGSLGEVAQQLGVTTDTLQAFRYAGTQVGVSSEEMDNSLGKLTKTIGAAATGNKTAIDSFNQFGIKILDATGKVRPTDDVILDIADAIQKLPDPAQKAAAAVDFFGKSGQRILPFLEDGAKGVDEFVEKAKGLGLVFDADTIKRADDAADKLATLSLVLKTDFQAALVQLAPILSQVAGKLVDLSGAVNSFFQDLKPDDQKDTAALEREFSDLGDQMDALMARRKQLQDMQADPSLIDKMTFRDFDSEINKTDDQITALGGKLARVQSLIDQKELASAGAGDTDKPKTTGTSNPPPTGEADAEKNIDRLQAKLTDLQNQLDDLDVNNAINDDVSKNLQGFDLKTNQAKELATSIAVVTQEINRAKLADAAYAAQQQADAVAVQKWTAEMARGKEVTESLRTPAEAYNATLTDLNKLLAEGAITEQTYARGVDQAKKSLDDASGATSVWSNTMTDLGSTFSSAFEDAAVAGSSLSDVLNGLLQDLERIFFRVAVEGPLLDALLGKAASGNTPATSGWLEQGFDWLSGLFSGSSGLGSSAANAIHGFASGGNVTGGQPIVVGEKGPEVWVPPANGYIIPNHSLNDAANLAPAVGRGGMQSNIAITNNVTVNASGGTPQQNADLADQTSKAITRSVNEAIDKRLNTQMRKGGSLNPGVAV